MRMRLGDDSPKGEVLVHAFFDAFPVGLSEFELL